MKVYTFYSFKGGVGRTALLMHLAVHWAGLGKVVAVVDMDLNAPGLSYSPLLKPHADPTLQDRGTSDLLATFYYSKDEITEKFDFFPPSKLFREMKPSNGEVKWGMNGRLLVIPAGTFNLPQTMEDGLDHRIPSATKQEGESFDRRALRSFAKLFRKNLAEFRLADHPKQAAIDYVLIDCRTGYPELADLAMGFMADRLVLVSGLNHQNLRGLTNTLEMLRPERVVPGAFASDLVLVFSPIPNNLYDDPETRRTLLQGVELLDNMRQEDEEAPPVYLLPYTRHLAISDEPVPRDLLLGKRHPYWQAVEEIAGELTPKTLEQNEIERQQELQSLGLPLSLQEEVPQNISNNPAPLNNSSALANLDGAGDPRELHLSCRDYPHPSGEISRG